MSDQNKLDFPDWLKVRDVVEAAIDGQIGAKAMAEELMVAGLIDIAAILGEPDEAPSAEDFGATHLWRETGPDGPENLHADAYVVIDRYVGLEHAIVRTRGGHTAKAKTEDLHPVQS